MAQVYGIGGLINVPAGPIEGYGVPPESFKGQLGQQYFDRSTSPPTEYVYNGVTWSTAGANPASNSTLGTVKIATLTELQNGNAPTDEPFVPLSNDVATVIQGIVVGAVPPANETQQGIAEIATQNETDTGTDDTRIVTPLKLATYVASGSGAGSFTDLTATGTVSFTGATGGITMTSATASSFGTTGAGIDLTLDSAAGRVVVNGEEAAADAVRILSAAGGLDVDVALQLNLTSSQNAVDAVRILASAGGIDIDAVGAATEDINITNTGGSIRLTATESATDSINIESTAGGVNILASGASAGEDINITATGSSVNVSSTENAALAISLTANGGTSETVRVRAQQGTGAASVQLLSDAGGVTVTGGIASANAINLTTSDAGGGITMTAGTAGILPSTTGAFTVVSTKNSAQAIELHANGGTSETIRLRADQGTAATSIDVLSDVGGITLNAGLGSASAINITSSAVGGGWTLNSGTAGVTLANTGKLSLAAAAASDITVTGAFNLTLASTLGRVIATSGIAAANAITLTASNAAGGFALSSGTGGVTLTNTGALSLAGSGASNITIATGDFSIIDTASSIILNGGEAVTDAIQLSPAAGGVQITSAINSANAIYLRANAGTSETIKIHADQGTGVASVNILSDVGGITLTATGLASADAINLEASAGGIDMDSALQTVITSSQAASTAIQLTASDAAGGINLTSGTGNVSVTGGHLSIASVAKTLLVNGGAVTDFIGTGVLTAGTQTIANTNIAAGDVILITRTAVNASTTLGMFTYTISAGASFTVTSVILGTPGSTQTGDVSSYAYFIVRPT